MTNKHFIALIALLTITIVLIDLYLMAFNHDRVRVTNRGSRTIQRSLRTRSIEDLVETFNSLSDYDRDILRNDFVDAINKIEEEEEQW